MLDLSLILSREDFIRIGSSLREEPFLNIKKVLNLIIKNQNNSKIRSLNIVLLLDLSVTVNLRDLILRLKKPMFMKSKSMEDPLRIKLSLDMVSLKRKLLLIKSLRTLKPLMSLVLLKVRDSVVLLRDLVVRNFQERLTEVLEKLDVLDHGIHLESNGLLPELVKWVITIELSRIRKSIELVKDLILLMLLLTLILLKRLSPQWEDSLDMEKSKMISYYLKDVVLDQSRDL